MTVHRFKGSGFKGSGFWVQRFRVLGSKVEESEVQYFSSSELQINPEP
jgi:predicted nucleic acid-binding Zn ribbon protein